MNKIFTLVVLLSTSMLVNAQNNGKAKNIKSLRTKANDHVMMQFTIDNWAGKPDSIATRGIGRGANIYIMMDYPFKSNPKFSAAIGVGVGTSGIFLSETVADINGTTTNLRFRKVDTTNHYKKYKVATAYLEVPVELRWVQNPANSDKSLKFAVGAKVGTLLSGYTKGKTLQNKNDNDLNKNIEKVKAKSYFNSTRIALTARIGWGHFSVFGQYQVTTTFKENIAPDIRPYSIGIAISGL